MTQYDILKTNASVLQVFLKNKIDIRDVERLAVFEEYTDMRNRGAKFEYTIKVLSEKYNISPRTITAIASRMIRELKV